MKGILMKPDMKQTLIAIAAVLVLLFGASTVSAADTCKVEMPASGQDYLGQPGVWTRLGQRLTITDRTLTAIGYQVCRVGTPTGDVILSIWDAETDMAIFTGVWGDAIDLPEGGAQGYISVPLDPPIRVDGDVRICAEYYGGNETDYVRVGYFSGDRITGEWYTNYLAYGAWHDIGEAEEGAYMYEYVCEEEAPGGGMSSLTWVLVLIGGFWFAAGATYLIRKRRKR